MCKMLMYLNAKIKDDSLLSKVAASADFEFEMTAGGGSSSSVRSSFQTASRQTRMSDPQDL